MASLHRSLKCQPARSCAREWIIFEDGSHSATSRGKTCMTTLPTYAMDENGQTRYHIYAACACTSAATMGNVETASKPATGDTWLKDPEKAKRFCLNAHHIAETSRATVRLKNCLDATPAHKKRGKKIAMMVRWNVGIK